MATCLGCGQALTKRHQKLYCSNACQGRVRKKRKLEAWLASGVAFVGSYATHYIKEYLYEQQGGKCAMCGHDSTWQGVPLSLVLDHIDGNAENNRRDNLRLLCPNCHSQLPTYKSRNRGNGRAWRRQRYADGKSY